MLFISAIYDKNKNIYYLNGKGRRGQSRHFVYQGTRFMYLVESDGESLKARGPLIGDVDIMVNTLLFSQPSSESPC